MRPRMRTVCEWRRPIYHWLFQLYFLVKFWKWCGWSKIKKSLRWQENWRFLLPMGHSFIRVLFTSKFNFSLFNRKRWDSNCDWTDESRDQRKIHTIFTLDWSSRSWPWRLQNRKTGPHARPSRILGYGLFSGNILLKHVFFTGDNSFQF